MVTQTEAGSAQVHSKLERTGSQRASCRPRLLLPGAALPRPLLMHQAAAPQLWKPQEHRKDSLSSQGKPLIQETKRWQAKVGAR